MTSVPSKVFRRDGVDSKLRDEQAGFRSGKGTVEHIFILRDIIEQVMEWQATIYIMVVDFKKVFDSVDQEIYGKSWRAVEFHAR